MIYYGHQSGTIKKQISKGLSLAIIMSSAFVTEACTDNVATSAPPPTELEPSVTLEEEPDTQEITQVYSNQIFDVTYSGDFDQFICSALKETLNDLPDDIDLIAKVRKDDPFDVFRLDRLIDEFREKDLPFFQWETVPIEERNRVAFASTARLGRAISVRQDGNMADGHKGDRKYKVQIFDEPYIYDNRHDFRSYDELRASPNVGSSEHMPIRRYRINEIYTLYDFNPLNGIENFTKENLLDWHRNRNPYFDSQYTIRGPNITLKYPFKKGEFEVRAGAWPMNHSHQVSDLLWDGKFLYAVSNQDYMRYQNRQFFSLNVTKVDPTQFVTVEIIEQDMLHYARGIKHKKEFKWDDGLEKPVNLCSISIKLKSSTGE